MWKPEHRLAARRVCQRYDSDLTDEEWALVAPIIPPGKRGGGKRTVNIREVLNGIFYVLWTGCQWKAAPKDLPPKSTLHWYFMLWDWDGTLDRIHHTSTWRCASRPDARQVRPPRSSTVKAPKRRKKGGLARRAGL